VKGGFLLDVVIRKSAPILKLLSGEDKALLVRGNSLLVLDLGLDVFDSVGGLNIEGDGFSGKGLDEDLHSSTKAKNKVKGGFLLNVVVGEGSSILKLLSGEDKALLIRWDSLLVLDLGLDVFDSIGGLNLEGDGLSGEGLDENLHDGLSVLSS